MPLIIILIIGERPVDYSDLPNEFRFDTWERPFTPRDPFTPQEGMLFCAASSTSPTCSFGPLRPLRLLAGLLPQALDPRRLVQPVLIDKDLFRARFYLPLVAE